MMNEFETFLNILFLYVIFLLVLIKRIWGKTGETDLDLPHLIIKRKKRSIHKDIPLTPQILREVIARFPTKRNYKTSRKKEGIIRVLFLYD